MAGIESSIFDVGTLDALSNQETPIHRLDPRIKLLTTLLFIFVVLSFHKYEVTRLIPFMFYPVVLIALGNLPVGTILKKMLLAAPFAVLIGMFNPLLDRTPHLLGSLEIAGGWLSFASILIRFALTVSSALAMVATTGFNAIAMATLKLGAPRAFATQLLFLYRYIFVLVDEASRMVRARALRSFGKRGTGIRVFSSMVGQLLLRTLDRAQRIHRAMLCRGFDGELRPAHPLKIRPRDIVFLLGWAAFFLIMRLVDVPHWMGGFVTELMR